jgi:hypothetical protein
MVARGVGRAQRLSFVAFQFLVGGALFGLEYDIAEKEVIARTLRLRGLILRGRR